MCEKDRTSISRPWSSRPWSKLCCITTNTSGCCGWNGCGLRRLRVVQVRACDFFA
jgi:hypothetical protein